MKKITVITTYSNLTQDEVEDWAENMSDNNETFAGLKEDFLEGLFVAYSSESPYSDASAITTIKLEGIHE